jgi:hypothetical protein
MFLAGEIFLLKKSFTPSISEIKNRQAFISLTGLPDLSLYLNAPSTRHRSISEIGKIFPNNPFGMDADFSSVVFKRTSKNAGITND